MSKPNHIAEQNGNMIEDLERRQHIRIVVSRGTLKEILFSTVLNKRNDFFGFLFALLYSNLRCKGRYSEKKELSLQQISLKGKACSRFFLERQEFAPAEKKIFLCKYAPFMRG